MMLSISGYSQTIHFVLFAATNDGSLGVASEATVRYFKYNFVSSLEAVGFRVNARYYDGANFIKSNYTNWVSNLYTSSNDVIIFYFTGHGSNDCNGDWSTPNNYPSLLMGQNNGVDVLKKVKSEMEIFNELKAKPHRLLLTIAEACNRCARERVSSGSEVVSYEMEDIDVTKLRSLFNASGDYIVSSSQKGELSHGTGLGFFTRAFTEVLTDETSKMSSSTPSWSTIFSKVSTRTTQIAYDHKDNYGNRYVQHPQFKVFNHNPNDFTILRAINLKSNTIFNNSSFVGNYQNGQKYGVGALKYSVGGYYFGGFYDGKYNSSNAIYISKDGSITVGDIKDNEFKSSSRHYDLYGKGNNGKYFKVICTVRGNYYIGETDSNGNYDGYGMFIEKNGSIWIGDWSNGRRYNGDFIRR